MQHEALPGDASSLIYLAKADQFAMANRSIGTIMAPPAVWHEAVDEGERIGAPEVVRIRAAERASFIERIDISRKEARRGIEIAITHRLGRGESEVLATAEQLGRALIDEGRGSRVAQALGVIPISTLLLPVIGMRRGALSHAEAVAAVRDLAVVMVVRAETLIAVEAELAKEMETET